MDDFLEKKPKKHSDAALATAARFSWALDLCPGPAGDQDPYIQLQAKLGSKLETLRQRS